MELNEFLTRKQKIDIMLGEQGWVVVDTMGIDARIKSILILFSVQKGLMI